MKKKIKNFVQKNERYIKTFIEAVCSYIALNLATADLSSDTAIKGLILGAFASAISIALNVNKEG